MEETSQDRLGTQEELGREVAARRSRSFEGLHLCDPLTGDQGSRDLSGRCGGRRAGRRGRESRW
eukprot:6374633-Heterocapsa_arctica.AAC.1